MFQVLTLMFRHRLHPQRRWRHKRSHDYNQYIRNHAVSFHRKTHAQCTVTAQDTRAQFTNAPRKRQGGAWRPGRYHSKTTSPWNAWRFRRACSSQSYNHAPCADNIYLINSLFLSQGNIDISRNDDTIWNTLLKAWPARYWPDMKTVFIPPLWTIFPIDFISNF